MPRPRLLLRPSFALAAALLLAGLTPPPGAEGGVATEARTPAEVYERGRDFRDAVRFVARDLALRAEARPEAGAGALMLVIDPTPSLVPRLKQLAAAIESVAAEGPPGLAIGVLGCGADRLRPDPDPARARVALEALAAIPVPGTKNLLRATRDAAAELRRTRGPLAICLVTADGGDAEDDVEATREALLDGGVAFYAIAPEAGFERAWQETFVPRNVPALGLVERFEPEPGSGDHDSLFYDGDVALGLVPYGWELDLAQLEFLWQRPPRYPVPSGFGYWAPASLAFSTGGRYFVTDFSATGSAAKRQASPVYDPGRLARFAPDLRPRARVLKDLDKDARARVIVRIWEHLADEACPVLQTLGSLEMVGGGLGLRPQRPVRSLQPLTVWYEEMDDVRRAIAHATARLERVNQALQWWAEVDGRARTPSDRQDPLSERVEADFQLLGTLLQQVRFHWLERVAALRRIKPLHVTYRRARLVPRLIAEGFERRPEARDLDDRERNLALAELWLRRMRLRSRYGGTPWELLLERQRLYTFDVDVEVLEEATAKKPNGKGGHGPAPTPPKPPPRPAAGPKPGSTPDRPTTGG